LSGSPFVENRTEQDNASQRQHEKEEKKQSYKKEIINLQMQIDQQTRDRRRNMESMKVKQIAQTKGPEQSSNKSHQGTNVKSVKPCVKQTIRNKGKPEYKQIREQLHITDEMNSMEDKEETFHTNTSGEYLAPKTRPHQSRTTIVEEIGPKLLEEVRKDVDTIL
jgi:hypothetical protein